MFFVARGRGLAFHYSAISVQRLLVEWRVWRHGTASSPEIEKSGRDKQEFAASSCQFNRFDCRQRLKLQSVPVLGR
jgi:hypothetical protein